MINMYKNRAILFLFSIILIINTVLMSLVFFAYSSIIKKDYNEKLTSVASQTVANANGVLSFFEEEIEVFINKYNVEEALESLRFETAFVRVDSTSFEKITIFKGLEPVYASRAEIVEFYRETEFDKKIIALSRDRQSGWLINEEKDSIVSPYERLVYVRTLFDADTKENIGCVVAEVSQNQLLRLLGLDEVEPDAKKKEFLPHSVGICVDGKIFLLGEGNVPRLVSKTEDLAVGRNEIHFVNSLDGKKFITVHNTKMLKSKIYMVLFLLITLFLVITFFSYRMLRFMVNEICERIDSLNHKIDLERTKAYEYQELYERFHKE